MTPRLNPRYTVRPHHQAHVIARAACLSLLLALAACAKADPTAPLPRLLTVAARESAWRRARPDNYSFVRTLYCFCLTVDPQRVTVRGGRVTAVVNLRTRLAEPAQPALAMDSLFALIRREAIDLPSWLEVTYDPRLGYPTRVAYGQREVDGGGVIVVDSLRPEP